VANTFKRNSNVRFDDVNGVGEAKAELEEILKDQTKFT
jgi:ATP-dependent Zn protease